MNLKIYTTPICPFCVKLKDFLKEKNIDFTEFNVFENQKAAIEMIEKTQQQGVPVIVVDNKWKDAMIGFSKTVLRKRLHLK